MQKPRRKIYINHCPNGIVHKVKIKKINKIQINRLFKESSRKFIFILTQVETIKKKKKKNDKKNILITIMSIKIMFKKRTIKKTFKLR